MNKGLRAATGEYVLYLNADDFLVAPDALATAMAGLTPGGEKNPDLVVGDVAMGLPGSKGFWRYRRVPRTLGRLRGTGLFPVHSAQFTKRSLLQSVGGFDSRLKLASDVTQYYDLERAYRPSVPVVGRNITVIRPGGAPHSNHQERQPSTLENHRPLEPHQLTLPPPPPH